MNETINPVHTPCKSCVFAIYENKTQVDCHLDYISAYKNSGAEILEAYDEEKEFYIVNNKKCIGYRENKWFEQYEMQNSTIEDKIQKYKETNQLHYSLVINLKSYDYDDLKSLCSQISQLSIVPQKIAFIRYKHNNTFPFEKIQNLLTEYKINIPWRVQTMLDNDEPYRLVLHNFVSINRQRFIVSVSEPANDLIEIINSANKIVHNDLDQLQVATNESRSITIFSGSVYRFAAVNQQDILSNPETFTVL